MSDAKASKITQAAARRKLEELVSGAAVGTVAGHSPGANHSPPESPVLSAEALREMMAECGIMPGDKLYAFFMVLGEGMRHVAAGTEAMNAKVRTTADAEAERVKAEVSKVEAESTERMVRALDLSVQSLFRTLQWRTVVALLGVVMVALATGVAGGWWLGWKDGRRDIAHLEGRLEEAFRDGADGAEIWLMLMDGNDPRTALGQCRDKMVFESQGRSACYMPLWIEEKPRSPNP